jgi:MarR family 2-MHQ and catechol resistance regulon transcriptional repressor
VIQVNGSLELEVYKALRDAYNGIKRELHNKLAQNGITWPQFHALYHIGDEGIPSHELAKELNCNASNMTGLIDRMEQNNWVYRVHCKDDRRVWLIKLTEEGKRLKEELIPRHQKNIEERMGVLSQEELKTLKSLLDKLMKG